MRGHDQAHQAATAGGLRAILAKWHARWPLTVVMALAPARSRDAPGLRELLRAHQPVAAADGGLRLVILAGGAVLRALSVTGLDSVIPHLATVTQALAKVPAAATPSLGLPWTWQLHRPAHQLASASAAATPPMAAAVSVAARCSCRSASTPGSATLTAGLPGTASISVVQPWTLARSPGRRPR